MDKILPTVIDLVLLKKDVLDKGASAALPCNLPDYWLELVLNSLDQVLESPGSESGKYLPGPLAIVVQILLGLSKSSKVEINNDRLYECLQYYYIEAKLEAVNRSSKVQTTPATLDTIFKNRIVASTRP